jgi:DNA-binding NarL/FixJ family response regulator
MPVELENTVSPVVAPPRTVPRTRPATALAGAGLPTAGLPTDPAGTVTALVVLENDLLRHGMCSMLRADPAIGDLWISGSVTEALELLACCPDVVLCDIGGLRVTELVQSALTRDVSTLVLLDDCAVEAADEAVMLKASGFLLQSELTVDTLREAVATVRSGQLAIPAALARALMTRAYRAPAPRSTSGIVLTPREQQVLTLLGQGLSNRQIARRLSISEHGVKRHVTNLLAKLNSPNRTLAVALAIREGLIDTDAPA